MDRGEPGGLQSVGSQRVGLRDWTCALEKTDLWRSSQRKPCHVKRKPLCLRSGSTGSSVILLPSHKMFTLSFSSVFSGFSSFLEPPTPVLITFIWWPGFLLHEKTGTVRRNLSFTGNGQPPSPSVSPPTKVSETPLLIHPLSPSQGLSSSKHPTPSQSSGCLPQQAQTHFSSSGHTAVNTMLSLTPARPAQSLPRFSAALQKVVR